ncbi:uncharacterized protein [Macrobrachium rosenbergii]|uniref:uncharacterized protein n=1 Tax=Macrobrachium rosenbergii TaxID=79674 RepID=UPI0034D73289
MYHKHPHYSYHHHYHHELHEHHQEPHHTDPKSLITEDEVRQSLHADKGEEAEMTSWEVVDFTKPGDNYSNFVTSIEVKYTLEDEEHEVVYIAKVNPCKKLEGFEEMNHMFFEKEVQFYTQLVPELNAALEEAGKEPLQIPKLYHASLETGSEQAYYEDLRARDFKMVDRIQSLDAAHTTLVLQEIAKLHAASRLLQEKSEEPLGEKYESILKGWGSFADNPLLVGMINGQLDHAEKILKKAGGDEKAVNWLEGLKPQAFEILGKQAGKDAFAAVNHGGLWSNNLLFRYNDDGEPEEVMLLDFETCCYSTLAHDLNFLMYTSLTEEVRKEHLEEFMGTYTAAYQEIIEAGGLEMPFNEEELTEEFRENNVLGALFAVLTIPAVLLESGDLPDGATIDGEMEEILDEFWANIDEKIETSPTLKPRFLAIFEEFMESGLISE